MTEINSATKLSPLDRFLCDIQATIGAAEFCTMHYIGLRSEQGILIEKGRLRLYNIEGIDNRQYAAGDIAAGEFTLSSNDIDPINAIDDLANGCLETSHGKLILRPEANRELRIEYDDMHSEGLQNQNRLSVMTLVGGPTYLEAEQPRVDWLLGASAQPYFSFQELAFDFHCGTPLKSGVTIEIIADNILFIDSQSIISNKTANLWIRMARQLDPSKVRLGYRLLLNGAVVDRSSIPGTGIEWEIREGILRGYVGIAVPDGSIMQCFASYGGIARHFYWVTDPSTAQNPKRAIFEIFDSKLDIFQEFLFRDQIKGRDARDFECAIAWLLWFLGFSVLNLGQTEKTRDAPDLIATTPSGDFAVIECTTGLLKAENKLSLLVERAIKVHRRLLECGSSHLRVLPVIVTSRTRDEVAADLESAKSLGVVVVTRENIIDSLGRSLLLPNANAVYEEGVESLRSPER